MKRSVNFSRVRRKDPIALALPRVVEQRDALLAVARRFLGRMEADGDECTCEPNDPCPLCACRAAIESVEGRP